MYYEDFAEDVKLHVQKIVDEQLEDGVVVIRTVIKNNNVRRKSLSILRKNQNATPTIYLKEYYDDYKKGRDVADISREIFGIYESGLDRFYETVDARDFSSFEKIENNIYCRLINVEKNRLLLKEIPYREFYDLAIVYYIMVDCDEDGCSTALIHNTHLESWGIDEEQLKEIAANNTIKDQPYCIRTMESVVTELIVDDICEQDNNEIVSEETIYNGNSNFNIKEIVEEEIEELKPDDYVGMYVVTNEQKNYGAVCITYPGFLEEIYNKLGSDYYIIPSSIHEVIVMPVVEKWKKSQMDMMVCDVNKNELDPTEILADHVYVYNSRTKKLEY